MKKYIVLLIFSAVSIVCFSQQKDQATVYLKNGNIIPGVIIERFPDESIKLKIDDTHILVIQKDEILKITEEPIQERSNSKRTYGGIFEMGYAIGVGYYGMNNRSVNFINSIKYSPYFSFGLGIGIRHYNIMYYKLPDRNLVSSEVQVPVFLDFRTNLLNNELSPYIALGLGGSLGARARGWSDWDIKGEGFLLNLSGGIRLKISEKSAMIAGIAYEMQGIEYHYYYSTGYSSFYFNYKKYIKNASSISINIGISF